MHSTVSNRNSPRVFSMSISILAANDPVSTQLLEADRWLRSQRVAAGANDTLASAASEAIAVYVMVRDAILLRWQKKRGSFLTSKEACRKLKRSSRPAALLAFGLLSEDSSLRAQRCNPTLSSSDSDLTVALNRSLCSPDDPPDRRPVRLHQFRLLVPLRPCAAGRAGV